MLPRRLRRRRQAEGLVLAPGAPVVEARVAPASTVLAARLTLDPVHDHEGEAAREAARAAAVDPAVLALFTAPVRAAADAIEEETYWRALDETRKLRVFAEREEVEPIDLGGMVLSPMAPPAPECGDLWMQVEPGPPTGRWCWEIATAAGRRVAAGTSGTWECALRDGGKVLSDLTAPVGS